MWSKTQSTTVMRQFMPFHVPSLYFFVLCHLLVLRVAVINKNEFREYNVQNVHPGFDSYVITREELRFATPKLMMQ